jgi:hypothetical protein
VFQICPLTFQSLLYSKDSDVLVYSTASHCAFPVIFKLDRGTGSCDVMNMDWLLSFAEDPSSMNKQAGSALETLLKNLGSRQKKRPGFGARLFVQGCVLAGCDYAPNRLSGIGLVNAFKQIRDCAFRNDSTRFAKVLDSLPRKNKLNVDTKEYELILAKSEAVFYYHLVRHSDGAIKPLCNARVSDEENGEAHHFSDHFPFLKRFEGDWSFLGVIEEVAFREQAPNMVQALPITEIVIPKEPRKAKRQAKHQAPLELPQHPKRESPQVKLIETPMWLSKNPKRDPQQVKKIENPYLAKKRPREEHRPPLNEVSQNELGNHRSRSNPFAKFARKADKKPASNGSCGSSMLKYLQKREDVRFVKRRFPAENCFNRHLTKSKPTATSTRLGAFSLGEKASTTQLEQIDLQLDEDPVGERPVSQGDHNSTIKSHGFQYEAGDETASDAAAVGPSSGADVDDCVAGTTNNFNNCRDDDNNTFDEVEPTFETHFDDTAIRAPLSRQEVPAFFDLTDSSSGHFALIDDGFVESGRFENSEPARVPLDSSIYGPTNARTEFEVENYDFDPEDHASDPPNLKFDPNDMDESQPRSKYFHKDKSRRVTLDPSDIQENRDTLCNESGFSPMSKPGSPTESHAFDTTCLEASTPQPKRFDDRADEIIESPPEIDEPNSFASSFRRNPYGSRSTGNSGNRYSSVARRPGPLETAFTRQERLSGSSPSKSRSWRHSAAMFKNSTSAHVKKSSPTLKSYFQPVKRKAAGFDQLMFNADTKQTEEAFLWDSP